MHGRRNLKNQNGKCAIKIKAQTGRHSIHGCKFEVSDQNPLFAFPTLFLLACLDDGRQEENEMASSGNQWGGFGPVRAAGGYDFVGGDFTGKNDVEYSDPLVTCMEGGHGTHVSGMIGIG